MKIKFLLSIAFVFSTSILTEPTFVNSQQIEPEKISSQSTENCDTLRAADKKTDATEAEKCLCELNSATEKPTYTIGDSPFGKNTAARKKSSKTRRGVAASPGAIESTEHSEMLGSLIVPNKDDLSSPEVEKLQQQLLEHRAERRKATQEDWKLYRGKELKSYPPNAVLPKYLANDVRDYKQFLDLENTDDWHLLPKFDWRERGLNVGAVLNQGKCGSCWAFAAVSTYQSSWNLEQMRTGDVVLREIVPENSYFKRRPSVQQLLNCTSKGDCDGGWHGNAFAYMVNSHVPHIPDRLVFNLDETIEVEEYTGRKSVCADPLRNKNVKRGGIQVVPMIGPDAAPRLMKNSDLLLTAQDRALSWGYVNTPFDKMPSIEQLKTALIKYGPLAAPMKADHCFAVYKSGVFNAHTNGRVNHVVVLIGWNDDKQAWLIKNSWGKNWGEGGFGWVKYGSNNIGLFAAWIQPSPINEDMPAAP